MKKDYTKPLLEIKEYEPKKVVAALEVSDKALTWFDNDTNGDYKEFEW